MRIAKKIMLWLLICALCAFCAVLMGANMHCVFSGNAGQCTPSIATAVRIIRENKTAAEICVYVFLLLLAAWLLMLAPVLFGFAANKTRKIVPGVRIPYPAGNGEYGTADFLPKSKFRQEFAYIVISPKNDLIKWLLFEAEKNPDTAVEIRDESIGKQGGGIILGRDRRRPIYYYNKEDTHTLVVGATRSGKTRTVSLSSLVFQALCGESIITQDPKGEMYLYTYPFLERLGYEVCAIDFSEPEKSTRYNFMQEVNDLLDDDDIPHAIEKARDIVTAIVPGSERGEPVWTNGERSIMACAIISVSWDNRDRPEYRNLTNVYFFIARMCRPNAEGVIPLATYLKSIKTFHPAMLCVDIAEIAPTKMRGSFYTSALTSLQVFTDPNIWAMTQFTDFDSYSTGFNKRAIFLIVPDEKATYYPLASLFISQEYQRLKKSSQKTGNRLDRRVNYNIEEIGNTSKIGDIKSMLTVGGGAGIRCNLFVQSKVQLEDIYDHETAQILRDNCETWIYLQTDNGEMLKEISDKLGSYTIKSSSVSVSDNGTSASYNLTGRPLLMPDEIKRIRRPYQLVTSRTAPAIMYGTDISETIFNKMLGLGDKEYNKQLIIRRQNLRKKRRVRVEDMKILSIQDYFPELAAGAEQSAKPAININGKIHLSPPEIMNPPVPYEAAEDYEDNDD